jgi:hypothetical protein
MLRKIVLALILAVASGSAAAQWEQWFVPRSNLSQWVAANTNGDITIYADVATIRRSGNSALMWDLTDMKSGRAIGEGKRTLSFRKEQEYDCSKQQVRTLYISWHSGNMGAGEILGSDASATDWRPVLLGTIREKLWQTACGK